MVATYSSTAGNRESLKQDAELLAADITITGMLKHVSEKTTSTYPRTSSRLYPLLVTSKADTNTGRDAFSQVREFEGQAQRIVNEYRLPRNKEDSAVIPTW